MFGAADQSEKGHVQRIAILIIVVIIFIIFIVMAFSRGTCAEQVAERIDCVV